MQADRKARAVEGRRGMVFDLIDGHIICVPRILVSPQLLASNTGYVSHLFLTVFKNVLTE